MVVLCKKTHNPVTFDRDMRTFIKGHFYEAQLNEFGIYRVQSNIRSFFTDGDDLLYFIFSYNKKTFELYFRVFAR